MKNNEEDEPCSEVKEWSNKKSVCKIAYPGYNKHGTICKYMTI
jgi:hypothetical protein